VRIVVRARAARVLARRGEPGGERNRSLCAVSFPNPWTEAPHGHDHARARATSLPSVRTDPA